MLSRKDRSSVHTSLKGNRCKRLLMDDAEISLTLVYTFDSNSSPGRILGLREAVRA